MSLGGWVLVAGALPVSEVPELLPSLLCGFREPQLVPSPTDVQGSELLTPALGGNELPGDQEPLVCF